MTVVSQLPVNCFKKKERKKATPRMSIAIQLNPSSVETVVHHLPCNLKYDGPCKVSTYFVPKPKEGGDGGAFTAYFRGRELSGLEQNLPVGVSGVVFRELVGSELDQSEIKSSAKNASLGEAAAAQSNLDETLSEGAGFFGGDLDDSEEGEEIQGAGQKEELGGAPLRVWTVDGKFSKVISWLHDVPATDHDLLPRALQWMKLSKTINSV